MSQDINYNDRYTLSPTLGSTVTQTIISIVTAEDLKLYNVDITQTLIHVDRLAEGFNTPLMHETRCT